MLEKPRPLYYPFEIISETTINVKILLAYLQIIAVRPQHIDYAHLKIRALLFMRW